MSKVVKVLEGTMKADSNIVHHTFVATILQNFGLFSFSSTSSLGGIRPQMNRDNPGKIAN